MMRFFGVGAAALAVAAGVQGETSTQGSGAPASPGYKVVPAANAAVAVPAAPATPPVDPARLQAARDLLRDMNFEHTVMTMLDAQKTQLRTMIENRLIMTPHGSATPAEMLALKNQMLDAWWQAVQPTEMLEQLAKVYAGIYTVSELQQMGAFYRTEAGRKYVETTPQLQSQCGAVMQAHLSAGYPKLTQLFGDFQKAHPVPNPKPAAAAAPGASPSPGPPMVKIPPTPPANVQTK